MFNYKADKKEMKTLVILFAGSRSRYMFDPLFAGKSAFERSLEWAGSLKKINESETVVFASESVKKSVEKVLSSATFLSSYDEKIEVCSETQWCVKTLLQHISVCAKERHADAVVFAWADQPFIDFRITESILHDHFEYKGEYTFADGYPGGLSPEVIDTGTADILFQFSDGIQAEFGKKAVERTSIFDLIKTDINSFDVETVIAERDYRLFRMSFNCATKAAATACRALFDCGIEGKTIDEISDIACSCVSVLKTLPSYYSIQITDKINVPAIYRPVDREVESLDGNRFMSLKDFKAIIKKISKFSENAVVSLSAWGEPLCHPDFIEMIRAVLAEDGLTALVETDGISVTEEMCSVLKKACDDSGENCNPGIAAGKIIWIVNVDAFSAQKYMQVHCAADCFEKAAAGVEMLKKYFPDSTFPQFTRMDENEDELESFWRYWSDKTKFKNNLLIVQKYDSLCGLLPYRKPADLSPLERNPCWHIRRDMTVLVDGSVCFCRCRLRRDIIGNAFSESLAEIWKRLTDEVQNQMNGNYSELCGKCDEYYTFNF